jgi:hypothetical protein
LRGIERPEDRLSETLRNIKTFGRPVHGKYLSWINAVTTSEVEQAVSALLSGTPTIIAEGAQASSLNTHF